MKKVLVQFHFPKLDVKAYDQAWADLRAAGHTNPKGLIHHVAAKNGNGLTVVDVWESEEAFSKLGEVLMPVLAKNGMGGVQPVILPVYFEYSGSAVPQSR